MDINEILRGVDCSCGRRHECDIEHVYIERGAIARLSELCAGYGRVLIVADENTYGAAGEAVCAAIGEKAAKKVIFSGATVLIPDEAAIERVRLDIDGIDLIIGIGSGVIQDLSKYVSHFSGIPYMIVATAPSMDGYASTGAAMILKGMKETVPAGLPWAIVADTDVLRNAPMDMIKAGYGDIIGKYSALCDWRLAQVINGEYLCEYIYGVTSEMIKNTLLTAEGLLKRDEQSVKALAEALVIVGIMMSFAGSSRPASGSEHHLSHFFEIVGIVKDEFYFTHGIDVAYSTVITSEVRERILNAAFDGERYVMPRDEYEREMHRVYGTVAEECIALQDRIENYATDRGAVYLEKEAEIKRILAEVPTADQIRDMLALVGLDMREFYAAYGEEKIRTAVRYAKDLKDRYTVLWINYDILGGTDR